MDRKRIKNWAMVAEIVSGVAVVITLVFLIVEVRGNSDLIRANAFNRSMESLNELRMLIATDEENLAVMREHWGIDSEDELRRQLLVVSLWSIYEKTYYSQKYGLVGQAEWERFDTRICRYIEIREDYWRFNVSVFLTEEFRNYVIDRCSIPTA